MASTLLLSSGLAGLIDMTMSKAHDFAHRLRPTMGPSGARGISMSRRKDSRMKIGIRLSVLTSITALVLFSLSPPARAATVGFDQISWSTGVGFEDQNSQVGQATMAFDASDLGSFTPDGSGGYYSFVNIVTSVAGGSNNNWAVHNLLVSFNNAGDLEGADLAPTADFDLGQTDGTAVSSLNYSITFSSSSLSLQPGSPLSSASVVNDTEVEGTSSDQTDFGDEAGAGAADFGAANGGLGRGAVAGSGGTATNIPKVAEAINGCAPGAKARSIAYLGNMFPSLNVTQSAQGIYGTLTNIMATSSNGTTAAGIVSGANAYFTSNNLSIAPTVYTNNIGMAINSLNSTGDVEIGINWGYRVIAGTNYYYGLHAAMITQIIAITNSLGQTVAYQIQYVDNPKQGMGIATNVPHSFYVDLNGNELGAPAGIQGSGVTGYFIENVQVPEPTSLAMAALGLGALASSVVFRRRKRNHS